MDGDCLLARLHERLASTEVRAALAEDPKLTSLVGNCLDRARELVEQRCTLEAQVWLAGITAIIERCRRTRVAAASTRSLQEERIAALVEALGHGVPATDLARLLRRGAALQPEVTGKLLDVADSALRRAE